MKHLLLAAAVAGLTVAGLTAQSPPQEIDPGTGPDPERVAEAIRKFKESHGSPAKTKEVTVDLTASSPLVPPPPPEPSPPAELNPPVSPPAPAAKTPATDPAKKPTAPEETPATVKEPGPTTEPAPAKDPAPEPAAAEPKESLTVKVEQLQSGGGPIDPKLVKLTAPFPAKPLGAIPPGWKLDPQADAPAFTRKVDLAAKTSISLTIKPHVLVPEADGSATFSINEPGFDSAHGYLQNQTVGAVLSRSIEQLDEDAKQLGNAIDQLQQLVSTLPKPEAPPAPKPLPKPVSNPKPSTKR